MADYSDPQAIYDDWIKTRDILMEREIQAEEAYDGPSLLRVKGMLRARWEVFVEDLKIAAMFKYLGIKI